MNGILGNDPVPGRFFGVGVGPGPAGYLSVAALAALQGADRLYLPRARSAPESVARQCIEGLDLPEERIREVEFLMDSDRAVLHQHYGDLARRIGADLSEGHHVAYLTIGDPLTYSTYGYVLAALRALLPGLAIRTYPGITSFAAAAAALHFPLGEGRERTLILPCPEGPQGLREEILAHDVVVLMKIGPRLSWVLDLLAAMGIAEHCAFARRIGLPGEILSTDLATLQADDPMGYLATLLIRKAACVRRHP